MPAPRVSAICIFLNEERFIAEAIESVLAQEFQDFELLLVDDGSTDGSTEIAKGYAERYPDKVIYLEHPGHENRGMSAARNLGISRARGEFIAVMDADDRWYPNKLAEQVAILDANPTVGVACGAYRVWRSWAGGTDDMYYSGHVADRASFAPETTLKLYPLGRMPNPTDPMVRRDIAVRVGGYVEEFRGLYEDQVFLSKLYLETGVFFSRNIWLDYRRHPDSSTANLAWADYEVMRSRFLDWFEGYLDGREVPSERKIRRAIRRARWEIRHPRLVRDYLRVRRRLFRLLRKLGIHALYRRAP